MSTITKEQLIERAKYGIERYTKAVAGFPRHMDVAMDLELARIALASLEAEAVAWRYRTTDIKGNPNPRWSFSEDASLLGLYQPLYAAPPAPLSVPDENGLFPCPFCGGRPEEDAGGCSEYDGHEHQDYSINCKSCGAEVYCAVGSFEKADIPCSCHHSAREVCVEKWNRRAAMLQGSDGKSPVIPDGWVLVPVEPTAEMQSAAAGAIRFDTTPINKLWTGNAVYRAMLAAAPQQEVKP
ncbi:hypothetical protein [Enterobacter asburiae]|uniref:Lar family restriction alleviation protein n=1 Tax=Enterobacter asburiae TaxID=61645 RepID=UPI002FD52CF8